MRRKNSVLHVTFNMGIGGTEQVIRQLIGAMDDIDHHVACIDGEIGPVGRLLQLEGIRHDAFTRRPGFDWALICALRQHIQQGNYQIVHCHQYTPFVYGVVAAFGTGARVIFTEHGRFYPDRYRYKALMLNPFLARLTSRIVAISYATRDALARYEFMPRKRIQIIYNGIRQVQISSTEKESVRRELGIPDNAFIFGTVSRLDPVKNQAMMIRAFLRFRKQHSDARLLIVGDGPERAALEQLCNDLGLDRDVIFTGFINMPQAHLAIMNVFLLSSFTEGTSMTLLEAMSLGIPTIATNVGGNPEVLTHNETGLLVTSDDGTAFGDAMENLYQDPGLRSYLGHNAQARFEEKFSARAMAESYRSCYLSLASRAP